ncbi:MAG: hypothetical protein DHS20C06_17220 [Hyphobacterium sp.]|nr:MAG: hypothetical protein DHS20C06_17220 [Hyphobacterium sp.]
MLSTFQARRVVLRVITGLFLSVFIHAPAVALTDGNTDTATVRLHVALGSLVGQADAEVSEDVIAEVLEIGADPLAHIEYGYATAHEHADSFSYLINLAEMAAAREAAGETAYLPADWRERARRYHALIADACDAPDEAIH